jgi:glycosyltransferase involved in cell wall biosynthesis
MIDNGKVDQSNPQHSNCDTPLVSVILPTYNRAFSLERAIRSVLRQTFQDFELILIDDGSTDNTQDIIQSIKDPRIRYLQLEANKGAGAARNIGILASSGKYIAFQDSDDEWLPKKLEIQIKMFNENPASSPDLGVVYTQFWREGRRRRSFFQVKGSQGNIQSDLMKGNFITTQSALVKRSCIERAGAFDPKLPCLLDWELWMRVSSYYSFAFIPEPLVRLYFSPDGISTDRHGLAKAYEMIYLKHRELFHEQGKKILAHHLYTTGNLFCLSKELKRGQDYLKKARRYYPLSIKYWLAGFFALFGQAVYQGAYKFKEMVTPDWY